MKQCISKCSGSIPQDIIISIHLSSYPTGTGESVLPNFEKIHPQTASVMLRPVHTVDGSSGSTNAVCTTTDTTTNSAISASAVDTGAVAPVDSAGIRSNISGNIGSSSGSSNTGVGNFGGSAGNNSNSGTDHTVDSSRVHVGKISSPVFTDDNFELVYDVEDQIGPAKTERRRGKKKMGGILIGGEVAGVQRDPVDSGSLRNEGGNQITGYAEQEHEGSDRSSRNFVVEAHHSPISRTPARRWSLGFELEDFDPF